MPELERRKNDTKVHERLAVLETTQVQLVSDTQKILEEVGKISTFMTEKGVIITQLSDAKLDTRLTKVETRNTVVQWVLGFVFATAAFKDWIFTKLF